MSESETPIVVVEPPKEDETEEPDDDVDQYRNKLDVRDSLESPPPYPASKQTEPKKDIKMMARIRQSRAESRGFMSFLCQFISIIYDTFGFTILLAVLVAVPVSMIVFGAMYLNDCPRQRYIPIYLLVTGCFGVARLTVDILQRICSAICYEKAKKTPKCLRKLNHALNTVVGCFLMAWFIAGNVWIFSIYRDFEPDHSSSSKYCARTLYYYAFWVTMATYILMAFSIFCFLFTLILACIMHN
jgi:hypothetical protein